MLGAEASTACKQQLFYSHIHLSSSSSTRTHLSLSSLVLQEGLRWESSRRRTWHMRQTALNCFLKQKAFLQSAASALGNMIMPLDCSKQMFLTKDKDMLNAGDMQVASLRAQAAIYPSMPCHCQLAGISFLLMWLLLQTRLPTG